MFGQSIKVAPIAVDLILSPTPGDLHFATKLQELIQDVVTEIDP